MRLKMFDEKIEGLDEETKNIYRIAELICRREYEKSFDLDLDLALGNPKNLMPFCYKDLRKTISFWESLKEKYLAKVEDPLASVIAFLCDVQTSGIYKLLQ